MRKITDPVERIVADALDSAGVRYVHESENNEETRQLDFVLPDYGVYVEVKALHAPRVVAQMSRVDNIIVIQGREAALAFADMFEMARDRGAENEHTDGLTRA